VSTLKQNLVKARGALVFLIGLTLAFWLVSSLEMWNPVPVNTEKATIINLDDAVVTKRAHRTLSAEELQWAKTAWHYFENNYVPETGLVNSADKYPAATMWDTASYLLGLIAAYRLDLVEEEEFSKRVDALLNTLATMPLFEEQLPNKSYHTASVAMVTYNNEETERGIGWSAIDVGRIMVPLNILVWQYPEHSSKVSQVLQHWKIDSLIDNAEMYGTAVNDAGETLLLQEGRLGYEEYAAKSLALISRDVGLAMDYEVRSERILCAGWPGVRLGPNFR